VAGKEGNDDGAKVTEPALLRCAFCKPLMQCAHWCLPHSFLQYDAEPPTTQMPTQTIKLKPPREAKPDEPIMKSANKNKTATVLPVNDTCALNYSNNSHISCDETDITIVGSSQPMTTLAIGTNNNNNNNMHSRHSHTAAVPFLVGERCDSRPLSGVLPRPSTHARSPTTCLPPTCTSSTWSPTTRMRAARRSCAWAPPPRRATWPPLLPTPGIKGVTGYKRTLEDEFRK
jgi:hypothetical protein